MPSGQTHWVGGQQQETTAIMTRFATALALLLGAATLGACVDTDDYRDRPWRDHHWRDRDHGPDRPGRPDGPDCGGPAIDCAPVPDIRPGGPDCAGGPATTPSP